MKPRFTHIALLVSNVDRTADFYLKYCDLKVVHRRVDPDTGYRVIWLGKNLNFVIVAMESNKMPIQSKAKPLSHLGFALDSREEVDEVAKIAQEEGFLNYGPTLLDPIAGYICEILDPDGNSVEFSYGQELGKENFL
ncbi:MAG: VOC family protein [Candidatus Melainabacteria bacterium]|nr:VOC family protein [Candidatus Melainabacteria bacterium]